MTLNLHLLIIDREYFDRFFRIFRGNRNGSERIMDIDFLREFIMLAEVGNYMAAADSLFISQPTLSRHIKHLEDDLGMPLFDRNPRKVELNRAGRIFLPYAKQMLTIQEEYTKAFQSLSMEDDALLRIGTIPMMVAYGITDIFQKFKKSNPQVSLMISEMKYHEMLKALDEKQCDFVFARETGKTEDDFERITIGKDRLVAVLPKEHPLAKCESLPLALLKEENLLLPVKDSASYHLCVQACMDAGFEPKVSFMSRGTATAIHLASRQMGVALLMKCPCQLEQTAEVALVEIEPCISATISVLYRKRDVMGPTAVKFLSMIRKLELKE